MSQSSLTTRVPHLRVPACAPRLARELDYSTSRGPCGQCGNPGPRTTVTARGPGRQRHQNFPSTEKKIEPRKTQPQVVLSCLWTLGSTAARFGVVSVNEDHVAKRVKYHIMSRWSKRFSQAGLAPSPQMQYITHTRAHRDSRDVLDP